VTTGEVITADMTTVEAATDAGETAGAVLAETEETHATIIIKNTIR
jgi:hypothetical protein